MGRYAQNDCYRRLLQIIRISGGNIQKDPLALAGSHHRVAGEHRMSINRRLQAIESKLARPVVEPVDMRSAYARLMITIAGEGRRGDTLTCFARTMRTNVPGLIALALGPMRKFERRYRKALERAGVRAFPDITPADVACEVVRMHLADDIVRQLIAACIEETGGPGGWFERIVGPPPWRPA